MLWSLFSLLIVCLFCCFSEQTHQNVVSGWGSALDMMHGMKIWFAACLDCVLFYFAHCVYFCFDFLQCIWLCVHRLEPCDSVAALSSLEASGLEYSLTNQRGRTMAQWRGFSISPVEWNMVGHATAQHLKTHPPAPSITFIDFIGLNLSNQVFSGILSKLWKLDLSFMSIVSKLKVLKLAYGTCLLRFHLFVLLPLCICWIPNP